MGHVENIVAMFKQDPSLYSLTGDLLRDERYSVRLGMAVLFEELALASGAALSMAIPSLLPLLQEKSPSLRGEAATLLGIIHTDEVMRHLQPLSHDSDPQVAEIAQDILDGWQ
jgi:HEAT repeat protein